MADDKAMKKAFDDDASDKSKKMWEALRKAQRAVYLVGHDVKKIQCKVADMNRKVTFDKAQEECFTFRIQITDQTYHKTVTSVKKVLQNGGVCVVLRAGDNSAMHIHSSLPIDVLLQKLKLSKPDVKVEHQAVFFFNVLGMNAEAEPTIEDALNCNALGGFINAAAVCGSTLALFTNPAVAQTPDIATELFTVALTFDRHHCPLSKALPLSKPYKLGVFGMWCSTRMLFTIKAALEEKLGDIGLISVMTNPAGRAVSVYVQGLENAIKARSKMVSILKSLGCRCASKNNRVLLFDTLGAHVANLHKEVKVEAARGNAAQYQEMLDPQIATPNPDQCLMRTSIINTIRNLGYVATIKGCAELVFNLNGMKCVSCAGKIRQAIQQGPQKHLSGYLNLYRNQLTVKTYDDAVEDSIAQIIKALRNIKVQAELVRVSHDLSDEPDPVTEEEYSILRRLTGKTLLRKEVGEENVEAFSDDSDALHSINSPITTASFHITGLSCQSCALLLRGTIKTIMQGVTSSAIDFASRTLYISYGSEAISVEEIRDKLSWLGHATSLLREGEDLKLKLTDTLWANENAAVPMEDEKTQAMLDSQLLLYELQPQPITPQPLLELKHYASIEETGVESPILPNGTSAPTYHHIATLPVHLLQDAKDTTQIPVYMSIFSQAVGDRGAEDHEDEFGEGKATGPFDALSETFFLVMQSPNGYSKDAQLLSCPAPCTDYMEPPVLHFAHHWTFWFDVTVDTKEKNAEDSLRQLGTFSTLQELWLFWNNLCISNLKDGCNLRLFRHDIQPTWEHPMNRNGGRWSARSLGKGKRFKLWTQVVLALTGEQLQDNSEHHVCGVCLSSKPGGDRIEVWVDGGYESQETPSGATVTAAGDPMDELLRKMLFPDEDKKYFFYQSHLDYIEQRKTQRGGRRAKARKQNQMDSGYDHDGAEETHSGQRRYYQDYEYGQSGPQYGGSGGSSGYHSAGKGGGGYGDMRSGGVLSGPGGPRPSHHMGGKGYMPPQTHPPYYGGKGHPSYHTKPHHYSPQSYGGFGSQMGGGKGSAFMYMQRQQMFMPSQPTMTPSEADNILAMHSMSGSGLSAPEPPPWSMETSKSSTNAQDEDDDDDYDPTAVGMEVGQLLEELHLEQYVPVMVQKGYEDWSSMQDLSETDLVEMGFKPGHRKRLLASLRSSH